MEGEDVGGFLMVNLNLYTTFTVASYGSSRDTCGGTCRGTGRRRIITIRRRPMRAPMAAARIMTIRPIAPAAAPATSMGSIHMHARGMAMISNGNLGTCDIIYKDFDLGTGTRNLRGALGGTNCGTRVTCGTRGGVCHIITSACSSGITTIRSHSILHTACPST